ncbi:MAG: hypothetical protein PHH93_08630 [Prolixibacteraceae bacterium]|nr:hypothetical protein [Prolixibacteraceae bacterium]
MNCHNHPTQPAVAQCVDCGKGLCGTCASNYLTPLCTPCNKSRISSEKSGIIKEMLLTFGVGAVLAFFFFQWTNGGHSYPLLYNIISFVIPFYVFSGIIPGWKTLTRITPNIFLFLPIIGWVLFFIVKLALSLVVGLVMLPIRTVRNVARLVALGKIRLS